MSLREAGGTSDRLSAIALLDQLEVRTKLLRDRSAELVDRQRILGLALATARAGVFQCALRDDALDWTDGVYDIFDVPKGSRVRREDILICYDPPSRAALERVRADAIRNCGSFTLDASIVTMKGARRWIRLTAAVESRDGVATRLYGMKQDITEAKAIADMTRRLAEVDAITGLANRAVFEARFTAGGERPGATLMLVDLDGFKTINDTFGHAFGDACLKQAAARLSSVCTNAELVARIGGDEFAVLLAGHLDRGAVERIAADVVAGMRSTVERHGRRIAFGASVGVAFAADDAPWEQFGHADAALYAAKDAGRSSYRLFEPGVDRLSRCAG